MALGCRLDRGSGGAVFTVTSFSYDTWVSYQDIWTPSPSPEVYHRPQSLLPCATTPISPVTASAASPHPWRTSPWLGVSCSVPDMYQICHTDHSSGPSGHDSGGGEFMIGSFIKWYIFRANWRWWIDGLRLPIGQRFWSRCVHGDILLIWHLLCVNRRWCSDAVMPRDYLFFGGSDGAAFTVTSFSG